VFAAGIWDFFYENSYIYRCHVRKYQISLLGKVGNPLQHFACQFDIYALLRVRFFISGVRWQQISGLSPATPWL
jgi:hypothetical protein